MATARSAIGRIDKVEALVSDLANKDPVARQRARESLVALGSNGVTSALVAELTDPREHVRWEAAKALVALKAPISAPALVNALDDDNEDVRWLAAEGLVALGKTGLMAVLSGLMKRSAATAFCRSAHHVLSGCSQEGNVKAIAPVLVALDGPEPGVCVPPAAYDALMDLKVGQCLES
jgi:HEAT repeat protein